MITWIKQLFCKHKYKEVDYGYEYIRMFHGRSEIGEIKNFDLEKEDMISISRKRLLMIQEKYFKDKTFSKYIRNPLAGDFAVEISDVVIKLEQQNKELIEVVNNFIDALTYNNRDNREEALEKAVCILSKYK